MPQRHAERDKQQRPIGDRANGQPEGDRGPTEIRRGRSFEASAGPVVDQLHAPGQPHGKRGGDQRDGASANSDGEGARSRRA